MTAAERRRKLREERTSKFKERLANRRSSRPETTDARSLQAKRRRERNPKEEQPTKTIGRDASKRNKRKLTKEGALKVAQVLPTKEGSLADTFVKGAELWQKYGKKQQKEDGQPTEKKPEQVQDTQKPPVEKPNTTTPGSKGIPNTKTRYNQGANTKNKGSNKVDSPAEKLKLTPDSKNWRKSDALTKLPGSNKVRGVMTKKAAAAFDKANQAALQKLKPNQFRQWGGWKGWG